MKTCKYIRDENGERSCDLGLFGGKPKPRNCIDCIRLGNNTPEFKAGLDELATKTHPSHRPKISGCCDSAENPPT